MNPIIPQLKLHAWADVIGATATLVNSTNIADIDRLAGGSYQLTLGTPISPLERIVSATIRTSGVARLIQVDDIGAATDLVLPVLTLTGFGLADGDFQILVMRMFLP